MNSFIYDIPTKVYFGEHQLSHLGEELAKYGKRVLLTYGGGSIKKSGLYDAVAAEVKAAGLTLFELSGIEPNPRIDSVRAGAELCKKERIDVLLAVGGGSTIDATKYIAAGACVDFDPWDFFSKWAPIERALPIVTVLTLSATSATPRPRIKSAVSRRRCCPRFLSSIPPTPIRSVPIKRPAAQRIL